MASDSIMNTGWHRGGFSTPVLGPGNLSMWDKQIVTGFGHIFDFNWAAQGQGTFAYAQQPLFQREVGMPGLGGTYEHVLLAFDPSDLHLLPHKALALGTSNGPAPLEPEALSVTVHSGLYLPNPELHWVELYDPQRRERVHLTPFEFRNLAEELVAEFEAAVLELEPKAVRKMRVSDSDADGSRWQRLRNLGQQLGSRSNQWRSASMNAVISQTMLLASLAAPRRISFGSLIRIRLWFSTYAASQACALDLTDDEAARTVPLSKLTLLYDTPRA